MPNYYKSKHFTKIITCLSVTFALLNLILVSGAGDDDSISTAELLIKFKASLTNSAALDNWADPTLGPLCSGNTSRWTGLKCWNGKPRGLKLEGMGLGGSIDMETLARVPRLYSLGLSNNSFEGPIPELKRLGGIRAVYLTGNRFSGEIPSDAFEGMKFLRKVGLGNNGFVGKLPESLAGLEKLMELEVDGNGFEGNIPDFPKRDWRDLSFARNRFSGRIPASLSHINQSAFIGNKGLCGAPLRPCKSSNNHIITVIIALSVLTLISAITLMACLKARHSRTQMPETKLGPQTKVYKRFTFRDNKAQYPDRYDKEGKKVEKTNLHFTRNSAERFELEDLLRASADVLGSGSFGSSYKAALFTGPALVVKRFRCVSNVGREGFQAHMSRIGKLAHPNILPIVAYYYTKEEKLLISNFVENGSLASHLHGKRAVGQKGLDWAARLKIIKGVSKGLMYLYREFADLSLPHGHLKSSNVLLDGDLNPLLADYALAPLVSARQFLAAHKSPESAQRDRVTKKTDVWSLGILILELLTGKFPANYLAPINDRGSGDLAVWVKSVVKEEWNGELFDKEMGGTKNAQGQMYKLLKIGMCCCDPVVDQRWDCLLATDRIDELREKDNVVGDETDYVSDWDVYYSSSSLSSHSDFSYSMKKV